MTDTFSSKPLAIWLFLTCALLIVMVDVGAITRLTESGLSIVDWHAAADMLPPLSPAAWETAFAKYQTSPEYHQINADMTLDAFKHIYFWEWLHRLLGRLIGMFYALPLLYFLARKKIPQPLIPRFIGFFILGGLQGAIGWYMVKSGLVHEPRVSHFRLALHLGTAFLLLSLLWAQAILLLPKAQLVLAKFSRPVMSSAVETSRPDPSALVGMTSFIKPSLRVHAWLGLGLLIVTMIWGAFTAGLDAGLACSDFPKTCHQWLPAELFFQGAFWRNILHDPVAVQYSHRVIATITFVTLFILGLRFIRTRITPLRQVGLGLHIMILLQWCLGIGTVQSHVMIGLAATHQLGAVVTLLLLVTLLVFVYRMASESTSLAPEHDGGF